MAKSLVHVILIFIIKKKKKNCHSHFVFKEQIPCGRPSLCLYETISHFLFTRLFCQIFQRYSYDFSIGLMVFLSFHENIKKKMNLASVALDQSKNLGGGLGQCCFFLIYIVSGSVQVNPVGDSGPSSGSLTFQMMRFQRKRSHSHTVGPSRH